VALLGVERGRDRAEPQVEAERVDDARLAEPDPVWLPVAGEQVLRQRRTVVGLLTLGADERDRSGMALGSQGLARAEAGE
jgi:hypothetical protein